MNIEQIRYRPDAPLVLRGISCTFEGGHNIGVVGRTGSGKTTFISALFRLVEPSGGKIIVDGIDICTIGLHDLRSRFGIIPQDPTLFNGTVRYNLDPLSQHSDNEIWEVNAEYNITILIIYQAYHSLTKLIQCCDFQGSWKVSAPGDYSGERRGPRRFRWVPCCNIIVIRYALLLTITTHLVSQLSMMAQTGAWGKGSCSVWGVLF